MEKIEKHEPNLQTLKTIRHKRATTYRKVVRWLWFATLAAPIGIALLFFMLSTQDLPTFEELENPKNKLASEIYAANGEVLGRYYIENRVPVTYEELSPHLVSALIATEDERYEKHCGIDPEALARVAIRTVIFRQRSAGGGSTISQQLAKLLYTKRPAKNIWQRATQKLKEWITAVKLERSYTKEEIIAMYFNEFNFINGAYGIRAASEIYFNESQDSLTVQEAATLVGMLKNPALFNPVRRPDTTKHRRMVVLSQMKKNGLLKAADYDSLRTLPLDMSNFKRKSHADGPAPYFRMELRKALKDILEKEEGRKPDGTKYNIFKDGLKIYTTLDPKMQAHAEAAMKEHMAQQQKKFWKIWKGKDPWDYRDEETTDRELAIRQRSLRQQMRNSRRYQNLWTKQLGPGLKALSDEVGYRLKPHDLERLVEESKEKGTISRLTAKKLIGPKRAAQYRKALKSPHWPRLKSQWKKLEKAAEGIFDKPVPMKVFAYNAKNEKDTTLSPLDSIKYHRMFLQTGILAADPLTGHVKAWVGGINHKYFQYDHVTSERQVGSTFKPFVYSTAIAQQGMSPCFQVDDIPYTIHQGEGNFYLPKDWTPNNADGRYSGEPYTLIRGLQWSKNTISVFLIKQLGDTEPIRQLVNNMGLSSSAQRPDGSFRIPKVPSICLGATDLTVLEMTGAYTTFANNGIYVKPAYISRIEDKNNRIIYQEIPEERVALHPNINYVMNYMLKRVMSQGIPGFGGIESEIGGKTGTTNDYVDGWFIGLTPSLVVGTWVGGEDRWIRFLSLRDGTGSKMARPFFSKFLHRIEDDPAVDYDKKARFPQPPGDIGIVLDCNEYETNEAPTDEEIEEDESFDDFSLDEEPPTAVDTTTAQRLLPDGDDQ